MNDILVIADTQISPESDVSHIEALSKYIWEHKPAHIVHIGDHWDFPSLSFYAKQVDKEGQRLIHDLQAGADALAMVMAYSEERLLRAKGKASYSPQLHFCTGNHEVRLFRMLENNPHLLGLVDLPKMISDAGWKYYEFLEPLIINEVVFRHYLVNPQTGKPVGGGIENKLNKTQYSFVHGHQQQYQYARRQNTLGKPHFGVCAGSFYITDEKYRGFENTEIRGFTHMRVFTNRYGYTDYDVEFVSLERLMENY